MGLRQVGKNIARMSVLLVLVSIAAFFLVTVSPLDPLRTNVGQAALGSMSQEQIAQLEEYWGVNTPPVKRYVSWAADFLRGDMGTSLLYRQPVSKVIGEKLANSLWLMASAWLVSGAVGFVLGVAAGARKGGLTDKLISAYALLTASIPAFWLALVLLMIFAVWLKVLPIGLSVPIGMEAPLSRWGTGWSTASYRWQPCPLPAFPISHFIQERRWQRSWRAIMCCLQGQEGNRSGKS